MQTKLKASFKCYLSAFCPGNRVRCSVDLLPIYVVTVSGSHRGEAKVRLCLNWQQVRADKTRRWVRARWQTPGYTLEHGPWVHDDRSWLCQDATWEGSAEERVRCQASGRSELKESRSRLQSSWPGHRWNEQKSTQKPRGSRRGNAMQWNPSWNANHDYVLTPEKGPQLLFGDTVRTVANRLGVWAVS